MVGINSRLHREQKIGKPRNPIAFKITVSFDGVLFQSVFSNYGHALFKKDLWLLMLLNRFYLLKSEVTLTSED